MKKRTLTLLEIMIVIFLITLITGAIGYNMRGSLDRGKVFRSEQAQEQLHDLLLICLDEEGDADKIVANTKYYLEKSGLAKDPKGLLKDGWGKPFKITVTADKLDFDVISEELLKHEKKQKKPSTSPGTSPETSPVHSP